MQQLPGRGSAARYGLCMLLQLRSELLHLSRAQHALLQQCLGLQLPQHGSWAAASRAHAHRAIRLEKGYQGCQDCQVDKS